MSYMNPMLNPYGFGQPFQPQPIQPAVMPAAQQQVVRVSGENGAKTYQIGPNSSAILLDESGLMIWLVTSDGAGYKTVQAYDIAPHKEKPAPDYGSLESRIKRLEDMINGRDSTYSSAAGEKQYPANAPAGKADDEHGPYSTESSARVEPAGYQQSAA